MTTKTKPRTPARPSAATVATAMGITTQQLQVAIKVAATVFELIAASGDDGIPSGHLYAATMSAFSDIGAYESCIGVLVKAGLVRRRGLILVAVPPAGAAK